MIHVLQDDTILKLRELTSNSLFATKYIISDKHTAALEWAETTKGITFLSKILFLTSAGDKL